MSAKIIGCDVGGTFTDLILLDEQSGALRIAKVPTTTHNQAEGVLAALEKTGAPIEDISLFIHGTTVATNALLERSRRRPSICRRTRTWCWRRATASSSTRPAVAAFGT
jgi:N-methylhydantoinase A